MDLHINLKLTKQSVNHIGSDDNWKFFVGKSNARHLSVPIKETNIGEALILARMLYLNSSGFDPDINKLISILEEEKEIVHLELKVM